MNERYRDGETYTPQQASEHADAWCVAHPAWVRICYIPDYDEYVSKRRKLPHGFISGKGVFYDRITDVPPFHNLMMVFRVGTKDAKAMRAATPSKPVA